MSSPQIRYIMTTHLMFLSDSDGQGGESSDGYLIYLFKRLRQSKISNLENQLSETRLFSWLCWLKLEW